MTTEAGEVLGGPWGSGREVTAVVPSPAPLVAEADLVLTMRTGRASGRPSFALPRAPRKTFTLREFERRIGAGPVTHGDDAGQRTRLLVLILT